MRSHPDVVILGAGVIGLTTALYLRRHGATVSVLERTEPGQESSWAGAGIIPWSPAPGRSDDARDLLASLSGQLHPQLSEQLLAETGIDNGYLRCGSWELSPATEPPPIALWQSLGVRFEVTDPPTCSAAEPALEPGMANVVLFPDTAQVRNPRHLKALLAWCARHEVHIEAGCEVTGFERSGERVIGVNTTQGVLRAESYLLCAGAWSEGLLSGLGCHPGIKPVRGQIALLNCAAPVLRRIVEVGKRYLVPRADGRVLVGSTEETVGFDRRTTATAIAELIRFAVSLVPALGEASVERCWAGLRPGSPDGRPFLGRVPGVDNLYLAAGHYRAGIQLSCATGLVMSELMLGQPPSVPLEAFRPDRGSAA